MGSLPARDRTARALVIRSMAYASIATPKRMMSSRPRAVVRSADAFFSLLVLEAEVGVGQRFEPDLLDGLSAPVAQTVGPLVDLGQGLVDPLNEVADVVDQGEVALPLERRGAGVGVLLVEPHLARELRLVRRERRLLQLVQLGLEVAALFQEAFLQLLDLFLGKGPGGGHVGIRGKLARGVGDSNQCTGSRPETGCTAWRKVQFREQSDDGNE